MELLDLKESLWQQFGASIDMLENALQKCPQEHWDGPQQFWYNGYHCLFFLDYYLSMNPKEFAPPPPFTLSEFEEGQLPERTYSKEELLNYLGACRSKCHELLLATNENRLGARWINASGSMNYSVLEILLYNMRHVQHHAAQLNLLLRQMVDDAPGWIKEANESL